MNNALSTEFVEYSDHGYLGISTMIQINELLDEELHVQFIDVTIDLDHFLALADSFL